ncbi:MAG: glycosyltransferase family 4 protein [Candidatus Yanofskybacteria bacterium]|nr:glycosyltransferase family 4 protein [Candidatus Yanofskybacteria bacterium]
MKKIKPIIITGFPYAFPYYFKVFEYLKNKDNFVFVLPKLWLAKAGKIRIKLEQKPDFTIYGLKSMSYGGHLIRGLFKGWLPGIFFLLPYLKIKYDAKVLYSCSEPNLLTTLCNGIIAKLCGLEHILFTWQNVVSEDRMTGLKLKLSNMLVRLNFWFADGVICGNKKAAKIIEELRSKKHELRILVSPIAGINTEKFRPLSRADIISDWRQKLGIKSDEKLILFYGALDKRKGLNVLIDAIKLLVTNYQLPVTKLIIVGTGSEEESLKLQVKSLKLQDKIIFLDWMPNDQLPALLNVSDIFVYPSVPSGGWEEQFGYAMAEASACGIPVVATKTGSIDEVVQDGKSGLLVEPNNPEQLAVAIYKILKDDDFAKQMGESGREYILNNFSHKVIASKIEEFLLRFTNK